MMFPGARSCLNPRLLCCVSRFRSTPSSYHIDALSSRLSPYTRTSAVTIPRQLAPTMGPAHGGVEFLGGISSWDREAHDKPDEKKPAQKITSSTISQSEIYKISDQEN
ncbi:hypothetical protein VPH35_122671 [Triticum aestivum]